MSTLGANSPLRRRPSRRTGIVLGIIVKALTSSIRDGSMASSTSKFASSIDSTSRISTVARWRPGQTRGPAPNCRNARMSCLPSCRQRSGS
jgi:hypothetical protein